MPWKCCAPSSKNRQGNCLTILSVWFFRDLDVIDRWRFIIAAMSVVALVVLIRHPLMPVYIDILRKVVGG